MDAQSSKHTALAIPGDKMLTCILKFHISRDEHFGSDMSNNWLKVLDLWLMTCQVEPVPLTDCQMGWDGCKKEPWPQVLRVGTCCQTACLFFYF